MKKTAVVLAATTLVVAIVALNLWRELHTGRQQVAALHTRVSELESAQQAAAAAKAAVPVVSTVVAAAPEVVATATAATSVPAAPAAKTPSVDPDAQGMREARAVMATPEAQAMMRNQVRTELARQYPDLAAELGLSPAQAEQVLDLLSKQAGSMMGETMGMLAGGTSADMQEMTKKMMEAAEAGDKEMAALLGSKYPKWQEYQGTIAARQQVDQLRSMLGSGDNALTEAKAKPLIAALGAENARLEKESDARQAYATGNSQNAIEAELKTAIEHNRRLVSVASAHLTAPQLEGYKRMLTQQENMMRMMMGRMGGGSGTPSQSGAPR